MRTMLALRPNARLPLYELGSRHVRIAGFGQRQADAQRPTMGFSGPTVELSKCAHM